MSGDPLRQLERWLEAAQDERVCLATATPDGVPSARMVLCRGMHEGSLIFFTDYRSRKAAELDANPRAALVFHWHELGRQLRVEGSTRRLAPAESDRYFLSRRRESRISAWASRQSAPIGSREDLDRQRLEVERRFGRDEVPRPDSWGGYSLQPCRIEFWNEGEHRFHDRVLFEQIGGKWTRSRLQP